MVTFFVMPSLTRIWYKPNLKEKDSRLKKLIIPIVTNSLRFPKTMVLLFLLIFGLPIYAVPDLVWDKLPYIKDIRPELETYLGGISQYFLENAKFNEYTNWDSKPTVYIYMELPFGSSFEQTNHLVKYFETGLLLQYPTIQMLADIYKTSVYIQISFPESKNFIGLEVKSRAMAMASDLGDIDISVSGIDMNYYHNSASSADYSNNNFKITGYNFNSLKKYGVFIGSILKENPRVRSIKIKSDRWGQEKKKHFNFLIDANKLISNGFNLERFLNALQSKVSTISEGSTFTNNKRTSIVYSGESKLQDLDIILLQDYHEKNKSVRLSDFVKANLETESDEINRVNQSYQLYVTFDYLGPYEFAAKFKKKILPTIAVPLGFTLTEDTYRYREEDKKAILWVAILAIILVFLVTASAYESFKISILILLSIPMSLVGIFLFYAESGMYFTMATKIGIILVCGLTVNSAMLFVSEVQEQSKKGLALIESIVKGLANVFRPMLMTMCVLVLGLMPMLFHPEKLGEDIWATLSYTAIGGLIASFVLITLVFPSLILLFYRKKGSL
jgi:HAE1 family hydrophobic/amphiphilic exporter-1